MRVKRYIVWGITVLLALALVRILSGPGTRHTREERSLVLSGSEQVDRITLKAESDSVTLQRTPRGWLAGGSSGVNPVTVGNLLYAAENLKVVSVMDRPDGCGPDHRVRVTFYSGDRVILRYSLYACNGIYLLKPEDRENYYRVELPGSADADLDRVYSARQSHFLEHVLVDIPPSEIAWVRVERRGEEPFRFSADNHGRITGSLPERDSLLPAARLDDLSIRLLFSYCSTIRYEREADPNARPAPDHFLARITLASREGEIHTLSVYSLPAGAAGRNNARSPADRNNPAGAADRNDAAGAAVSPSQGVTVSPPRLTATSPPQGTDLLLPGEGEGDDLFRALVIHDNDPVPKVVNYIFLDVLMRGIGHYLTPGQ